MNSVVIIVHNILKRSKEILSMTDACLRTLRETVDQPYQLILMNNGSSDEGECSELLTRYLEPGRDSYIATAENRPIAACWNEAISCAGGGTIMLINNDVVFNKKGWMSALSTPLNFENTGATGSHRMSWNGFEFLEGSFLAFNKQRVMHILGADGKLFDEQFKFSCEEVDFCHRLTLAGLSLVETSVETGGLATHLHHGTLMWSNEDTAGYGGSILDVMHESRRLLCRKYGKPETHND